MNKQYDSNFFFHLKEQFDPLQNMEIIKKFPTGKHILDKNYASPNLKSFETDIFKIAQIELFVTPAGGKLGIHIDSASPSGSVKMNFSYGDSNAYMEWFKFKNGFAIPKNEWLDSRDYEMDQEEDQNKITLRYHDNDCELICSELIRRPSIVNVSSPHGLNCENSDIKCMTVAVLFEQYLNNKWNKITMPKALELWGDR
jgi:hypothetical protein